jgi:hypothetical protein
MSHSSNSSSCCCCETEKVCRLKVERSAKIGNNLSVGGNTITEGSLLPHRYVHAILTAPQIIGNTDDVVEFHGVSNSNELSYNTAPGATVNGFTVPQTGIYSFKTALQWEPNNNINARVVGLRVRKAGSSSFVQLHFTNNMNFVGGTYSASSDSAVYFFEAGDFVQVVAAQNTLSPLSIYAAVPSLPEITSFVEITQLR